MERLNVYKTKPRLWLTNPTKKILFAEQTKVFPSQQTHMKESEERKSRKIG